MDKLKPCPFCGEEDDIHSYTDEVICGSCGCHVGSMHKTKEINAEIWNTRSQAEIDDLTDALIYCYNHTMTPMAVEMLRRGEDPFLILRLIEKHKRFNTKVKKGE